MTISIEREVPRFGYMLPLPSDMNEVMGEPVQKLGKLWINIYREKLHKHDKEKMAELVNEFFDNLPEEQREWLEEEDKMHKKPRSVLVKERAIQYVQILETPTNKRRLKKPTEEEVFPS